MYVKPIISLLLVIMLAGLAPPPAARAQDGGYSPSGTGQEAICRGDRNWAAVGVAIWNQFMDPRDFWEYVKDIFVRYNDNFCHYEDIYGLLKRADKAREQVRKAFYNCTSTDKTVKSYYRLEAEIYFLRYYIDWEKKPDENGVEQVKYSIRNSDADWRDFNDNLYDSLQEIDALYTEFYNKYNGRMDTYNKCRDPGIETLIYRFQEDLDYLSNTVKKAGKSISQKAGKLKDTASSLVNSIATGEYFKNMVQVNINGMRCPILAAALAPSDEVLTQRLLDAEKALNDAIAKAANDNSPEAKAAVENARKAFEAAQINPKKECAIATNDILSEMRKNTQIYSRGVTYDVAQNTSDNIKEQMKKGVTDAGVLAKYAFLYYEASDNITNEIIKKLESTYNIIEKITPPFLNQTIRCVRSIGNSQCANVMGAGTSY